MLCGFILAFPFSGGNHLRTQHLLRPLCKHVRPPTTAVSPSLLLLLMLCAVKEPRTPLFLIKRPQPRVYKQPCSADGSYLHFKILS